MDSDPALAQGSCFPTCTSAVALRKPRFSLSEELPQNQGKYFAWEIWLDMNGGDIYTLHSGTFWKI